MQSRSFKVEIFRVEIIFGNQNFKVFPIDIIHLVLCHILYLTFYQIIIGSLSLSEQRRDFRFRCCTLVPRERDSPYQTM
jgi:hypothetical protein